MPVIEDTFTTELLDFDHLVEKIEFLASVINQERGIFTFKVEVVDSFNKVIGDDQLEQLLVDLINTLKPAHSVAIVNFVD